MSYLLTFFLKLVAVLSIVTSFELQHILHQKIKYLKQNARKSSLIVATGLTYFGLATSHNLIIQPISPVIAANLPASNGASSNNHGQLASLIPVIQISDAISSALKSLPQVLELDSFQFNISLISVFFVILLEDRE